MMRLNSKSDNKYITTKNLEALVKINYTAKTDGNTRGDQNDTDLYKLYNRTRVQGKPQAQRMYIHEKHSTSQLSN